MGNRVLSLLTPIQEMVAVPRGFYIAAVGITDLDVQHGRSTVYLHFVLTRMFIGCSKNRERGSPNRC